MLQLFDIEQLNLAPNTQILHKFYVLNVSNRCQGWVTNMHSCLSLLWAKVWLGLNRECSSQAIITQIIGRCLLLTSSKLFSFVFYLSIFLTPYLHSYLFCFRGNEHAWRMKSKLANLRSGKATFRQRKGNRIFGKKQVLVLFCYTNYL